MALDSYAAMRRRLRALIGAAGCVAVTLGGAHGCTRSAFSCTDPGDCLDGTRAGVCEPSGFCSFDDTGCDSGRRYGEHADDGLAGTCVPTGGEGTADTSASSGADTEVTSASDPSATAGGPDPYGPCRSSSDCEVSDAVCVSNGSNHMCAPPCSTPSSTDECPAAPGASGGVGCLYTDAAMTTVRCFVLCDADTPCPAGMTCVDPVCTWAE